MEAKLALKESMLLMPDGASSVLIFGLGLVHFPTLSFIHPEVQRCWFGCWMLYVGAEFGMQLTIQPAIPSYTQQARQCLYRWRGEWPVSGRDPFDPSRTCVNGTYTCNCQPWSTSGRSVLVLRPTFQLLNGPLLDDSSISDISRHHVRIRLLLHSGYGAS